MVCTEPLPNDRVPMTVARLRSCNAPATISDADADPPLIKTISGLPLVRWPPPPSSNQFQADKPQPVHPVVAGAFRCCGPDTITAVSVVRADCSLERS